MADLTTTVDLIFQGVDNASKQITTIGTSVKDFNKNLKDITGPLSDVSKKVLTLEAVVIGSAVALGTTAYNAAVTYQSALVELEKVYSDQTITIDQFKQQVSELAKQYGISGVVALESATDFVKAGNSSAESLKLTALALELAEAAQVDYKLATETVTVASKSFGLEADELRTKFDFLNTAVDSSAVSGQQLIEAFGGAASAAGAVGLSFEEYISRLIPGIERTQETAEVSRALRGVFVSMIRPTEEQADTLERMGVALTDSSGNATLARDRIEQFFNIVQDSTGATKEYTLAIVGGKDQFDRLSAVVGGTTKTQELLNISTSEYITLAEEFARRADTSEFALAKLVATFGALNTVIGQQTQDNVDGIVVALIALGEALDTAIKAGALEDVFEAIGAELDAFSEIILQVAENLPAALEGVDFTALADSIGNLGESIRSFFGVDLTTADGLQNAIQGIVDGIAALNNVTTGILESLSQFVQAFISLAQSGADTSATTQQLIGNVLGFAQGLNTLIPLVNTLITASIALISVKALGGLPALLSGAAGLVSLLGPVGLAGAVALAAAAAADWLFDLNLIPKALGAQKTATVDVVEAIDRYNKATLDSLDTVDQQLVDFQALRKEYDALLGKYADVSTESVALAQSFEETGKATDLTRQEFEALIEQLEIQEQIQAVVNDTVRDFPIALQPASDAVRQYVRELDEQGNLTIRAAEEGEKLGDVLYTNTQTLRDGTQVVNEFYGALNSGAPAKAAEDSRSLSEQLGAAAASGELAKDKYFELRTELEKEELKARVEFDIAQLEQDTIRIQSQIQGVIDLAQIKATIDIAEIEAGVAKTEAAFIGLQNVFDVTGNSISELIDAIAGVDEADKFARQKIEIFQDALDRQITLQEVALESQVELNDAIIGELNARAQRLRSGESLITIDGAGLQPELEAFMFRIIETVQVSANADGQAFLLGI